MPRVDIHFHLLPGVDDGPSTMEESVELARDATRDGTHTVVATPHVKPDQVTDVRGLPDLVREVAERLEAESVHVQVLGAGELAHSMVGRLSQPELETIAVGPPGARWLLLEMPFDGLEPDFHAAAEELRERGFGVVLAHPERTAGVLDDGALALRREVARGSVLQVNSWSLAGGHGASAEAAAGSLLRAGLVGAIASDAHPGWRRPALGVGLESALAADVDWRTARDLVDLRPWRLVEAGRRAFGGRRLTVGGSAAELYPARSRAGG